MVNYNLNVKDELTDQEKDLIVNLIKLYLPWVEVQKPIQESDWRNQLKDYAQSIYQSGNECTYQSMGINYQALGVRCVR